MSNKHAFGERFSVEEFDGRFSRISVYVALYVSSILNRHFYKITLHILYLLKRSQLSLLLLLNALRFI